MAHRKGGAAAHAHTGPKCKGKDNCDPLSGEVSAPGGGKRRRMEGEELARYHHVPVSSSDRDHDFDFWCHASRARCHQSPPHCYPHCARVNRAVLSFCSLLSGSICFQCVAVIASASHNNARSRRYALSFASVRPEQQDLRSFLMSNKHRLGAKAAQPRKDTAYTQRQDAAPAQGHRRLAGAAGRTPAGVVPKTCAPEDQDCQYQNTQRGDAMMATCVLPTAAPLATAPLQFSNGVAVPDCGYVLHPVVALPALRAITHAPLVWCCAASRRVTAI